MDYEVCTRVRSEAASFVLGDVPAEARASMVTHLDSCGTCRREVATLAETLDAMSMAVVPLPTSPGFVDRVLAAGEPLVARHDAPRTIEVRSPARPVAVVLRRRRTLLALTAATAGLSLMAVGFQASPFGVLAVLCAVLETAYLGLVIGVTHTKARYDLASAFGVASSTDDVSWSDFQPDLVPATGGGDRSYETPLAAAGPVVGVGNEALLRFVLAYFVGWVLTPVVALIALVRGDLTGIEQSPLLGQIVALQRRGRAQSLKLLVAGATTVAVAGGGTATMIIAPGMAAAAPAGPTYTVHSGDTLSGIAARYGVPTSYLARINGIEDPNLILPGEVIRLGGTGTPAASAPAASAPAPSGSYMVRAGDTLDSIAGRFGVTASALAALNHLADPNLILVGQVLRLPTGAAASGGTAAPSGAGRAAGTYTVRAGDTLGAIAARFGTTVGSLAAANHIADPNLIEVGQVLTLAPDSSPASTPTTAAPAPATTTSAPVSSGYVNPFRFGSWSPSRIDEGVDWIPNVASPVVAIGDAVITYSSMNSGWPAGGFIAYRLTSGSHAGLYVYVAEHITGLAPVGTVVRAGQQIATALPGYPWTEWGWASASGPEPAPSARYGGAADGTATPGGRAFARFLISLGVTGMADPGPGSTTP